MSLEIFVGEWAVEASFPGMPPTAARSVFEWTLGGTYLAQRTEIPIPEAPDSFSLVAARAENGRYTQHYFDSRGVSRVYAMTFDDRVWTLTRETGDFSPFHFAQRFTGTFTVDGNRIDGAWEKAMPGAEWEHDFGLTYTRLG
ncbi:hypothetical protein O7635_34795 [Asanoa sp. WMMD1127]|uniref:hypothetical protein n=1 Tax=Asanoa sp. WMMD1127 TaxID=3016107 RepID=UPI002417CE17|nr:hypothetical protein [Asanoa sp. WMMD1127]MDG4827043.1 hypothetical protein [Asanoa sp. WMMD1127]